MVSRLGGWLTECASNSLTKQCHKWQWKEIGLPSYSQHEDKSKIFAVISLKVASLVLLVQPERYISLVSVLRIDTGNPEIATVHLASVSLSVITLSCRGSHVTSELWQLYHASMDQYMDNMRCEITRRKSFHEDSLPNHLRVEILVTKGFYFGKQFYIAELHFRLTITAMHRKS